MLIAFLNKRQLLRCISLDRICRLADIGERSLSFEIRRTYNVTFCSHDYSGPAKVFRVQFYYYDPKVLRGNPLIRAGDVYEIDTVRDATGMEELVAKKILAIKNSRFRE